MPKFPKGFSRRKSSGNAFEDVQALPVAESTFKVFERPDGGSKSFDGGVKLSKATTNHLPPPPASRPRTSHREGNMFEGIMNGNRGSGGSNSNTAYTTDNSSRLSAASTAPSSTASRNEEWKSSHDKPSHDIPAPRVPKTQSGFSLKSAGRSLSWGRNKPNKTPTPPPPISKDLPSLPSPPAQDGYQSRQRAVTASSYASTATPPKLDERDLDLSIGGDFSDLFSGFGKRKSQMLEAEKNRAMSRSPDLPPSGPASRIQPSSRLNIPTPLNIDKNKEIETAPYSWSTQHSHDGLISNTSPPAFAPRNDENVPPVPQHSTPLRKPITSPAGVSRQHARPPLTESGVRRNSAYSGPRQSIIDVGDDEDAKLLRESVLASRKLNTPSYSPQVRESWALPPTDTFKVDNIALSSWTTPSEEPTPRNPNATLPRDDSLFDDQILESANLAQKLANSTISPPKQGTAGKVMTPAQFERYRQDQERMRSVGGQSKDDDDEEDDTYEEEEDEAEKNRQLAKQRRKQEAHMSVYRQQMMKVTGETASSAGSPMISGKSSSLGNRPSIYATQSSPNLSNLGVPEEGEEEDEEVPLAILQAHGFPNKNKPPMRTSGSHTNLRAQASAGPLPVFARHLPEDPYVGAGLVHPTHRESMAFGGGAGSAYGGPARNAPPGGLIGVIATEERSRAMRRGSPNPQGEYGPPPANGFNGMGMPPNMMNGMGQMGMPMMHPGDPMNAQMQQMQEFMRVQMQFMQMMSQGPQNGSMNGQMQPPFIPPQDFQRPNSAHGIPNGSPMLRPGSSHQRAMSMLDPNSAPWMQQGGMQQGGMYAPSMHGQGGYTPSIAPSERSNVGLPGRYRPVSHMPQASDSKSRASTMTGALGGWEARNGQTTIKPVKKEAEDDDDEEGWEEMKKKRQQKKSLWKSKAKKDSNNNGLKDLLGYAQ